LWCFWVWMIAKWCVMFFLFLRPRLRDKKQTEGLARQVATTSSQVPAWCYAVSIRSLVDSCKDTFLSPATRDELCHVILSGRILPFHPMLLQAYAVHAISTERAWFWKQKKTRTNSTNWKKAKCGLTTPWMRIFLSRSSDGYLCASHVEALIARVTNLEPRGIWTISLP
jgi:hypothetical protein